jgi:DNA-binding response OmpR family regulator
MHVQKLKALVVDDDPIVRRLVAYSLGEEGFECACAEDGDDALRQLAAEQFDLVVTDLCMPQKHGHALAVDLLARENGPVIVVYTAVDDARMTRDLMTRGVDDIVYKPANYPAFAAKARALVQRRKKASAQAAAAAATSFPTPGDASTGTTVLPDMQSVAGIETLSPEIH